ncbi:hypothetical protein MLD38_038234 [Melastoma candidum]|uniref:Uncharacterized protein n=1 Tax=Melastoma candidum TaxID=119954 RepID=A0ACB9KZG4_9MYRT|nr:hypothetical protein MLD38_038234 [Melastoma candidum]
MEGRGRVVCLENEALVEYLLQKKTELAEGPKGLSENLEMTLNKALFNISTSKTAFTSLKELSQVKGVGKWSLRLVRGFFKDDVVSSETEDKAVKGKAAKGTKQYLPKKNSVAYSLLITLYRASLDGQEFMHRQELIDSAEASGLSRAPIAPDTGKGKSNKFGNSPSGWYSGWSCMKTLITKGLVVKSSCPAKYMLSQEGKDVAQECAMRSGLIQSGSSLNANSSHFDITIEHSPEVASPDSYTEEVTHMSNDLRAQLSSSIPKQFIEKLMGMGYTKERVIRAYAEVLESSSSKDISAAWLAVLCRLREDHVYACSRSTTGASSSVRGFKEACKNSRAEPCEGKSKACSEPSNRLQDSFHLKACSSYGTNAGKLGPFTKEQSTIALSRPPLNFGETFLSTYAIILILDDREQFATRGSRSRKIIDNICSQFSIKVEVRRLPIGDGIWIARHKYLETEYVLDFIVERKKVDDLRSSIRDNRYKDQKLKLLRCGLKKLIYLVEGDPNSSEAAESIKTACFTTEILEGFDVQRTSSLLDTLKKYGNLTQAITNYYMSLVQDEPSKLFRPCPLFDEFVKRCHEADKMTISDVFAMQLMQVPQVTEEVALAVLDLYPTLVSLANAYSLLDGDVCAQEEMLCKQSSNLVNPVASKNIFQLVWGD